MNKKIISGLLAITLIVGGGVYYFNSSEVEADGIETVAEVYDDGNLETSKVKANVADRNYYGCHRRYSNLTDEELKDLREKGYLEPIFRGLTDTEYNSLTEVEKKDLLNRVKENRNLTDKEAESLLKSDNYCIRNNITREEYNKLSDTEKDELLRSNNNYGYGRHHKNYDNRGNIDRNNTSNSYGHHSNMNYRGQHGRGRCHR